MNEGIAYCKMLFENGIGSDFIYLAVNPRFEALTGLTDVIGKRATEVLPLFRDLDPGAFEILWQGGADWCTREVREVPQRISAVVRYVGVQPGARLCLSGI